MRKGLQSMWNTTNKSKTIKLNNEDFECHPDGECWCKEEEFPPIPEQYDKTQCLSPEAIEQLRLEENLVDRLDQKFSASE